MPENSR
nr:unnamed protein product [Callosobruchus chinensis]